MTAQVGSSLVRVLSGHMEEQHAGNSDILITKDLLGNLSNAKPTTPKAIDLEFKLQSCSTPSPYQSVCTLDKVKHALERAEKGGNMKKRSSSPPPPPSSPPATSSSSTPRMFAAACPGCLLYVIASNTNPRCPRCNSFVPSSLPMKKPRIDLNASF
ncbi:hypothetical protein Gotur_020279 [Gossypium turneri]